MRFGLAFDYASLWLLNSAAGADIGGSGGLTANLLDESNNELLDENGASLYAET